MRSQWHVGNQIMVQPLRPAGAIGVSKNFHHSSGSISVEGSSAGQNGGAVLWRAPLELLGTAPDVCGDCSPLDTLLGYLLGSGKTLVEFPLPFRILHFLASGVPADFRQASRSAFQRQVRSTSTNTSLSPVEALR